MEELLNYIAGAILFSPAIALLAVFIVFALCAIAVAMFDLAILYDEMRNRMQTAWRDFMTGFRKGMADHAARHNL